MSHELERAAELAAGFLDSLDGAVGADPDTEILRARLARSLDDEGVPPTRVLEELAADAAPGLLRSSSGRFYGWVIGSTLPVSIGADWLTSAWDQNAAAFSCSPSAAIVEDVVAGWIKELLGLPADASYAFVTGCQMAHFTGLAAARHRLLERRGWSVEERGLAGSPPIRVLSGERHETLVRALRHLGIGSAAVESVDQRDDGPLDVDHLARRLAERDAPTVVALAAGDLNRGAFDPFDAVCDVAHEHGAWVHVDGAFGLWAGASERLRPLVRGIERADSWATDGHKWLNVPYDSGIAFVADPEAHRAAMSIPVAYKVPVDGVRDAYEWGPEWSRRARGFPLYAALRALGRNGVRDLVERCCDHARTLVERLGELPDVEVLARPVINQGLVRFRAPGGGTADHDDRTDAVIDRIQRGGEAWFGPVTWRGMRAMRVSVCSWRTDAADVERTVAAVRAALEVDTVSHTRSPPAE